MGAVNIRLSKSGQAGRPVCEYCGRTTRRFHRLTPLGSVDLFDMPAGWSIAPYPSDWEDSWDGAHGSRYTCPECNRALRRGDRLAIKRDRG